MDDDVEKALPPLVMAQLPEGLRAGRMIDNTQEGSVQTIQKMLRASVGLDEPYQPPAPSSIPRVRDELRRGLSEHFVVNHTATSIARGLGSIVPIFMDEVHWLQFETSGNLRIPQDSLWSSAAALHSDEQARLKRATLYSVIEDTANLAIGLGQRRPNLALERASLPSAAGFAVFDKPIGRYTHNLSEMPVDIVAVSWGPTSLDLPHTVAEEGKRVPSRFHRDALWLTFWSRDPVYDLQPIVIDGTAVMDPERIVRYMPLSWDSEALLVLDGDEDDAPLLAPLVRDGGWAATVVGLFDAIATDRLTHSDHQKHSRRVVSEGRRRAKKQYVDEEVVVVGLRRNVSRARHEGESETSFGETRHISVRYEVDDFYQNRIRKDGVKRPCLIRGHIRGPEGAPFSPKKTTVRRG